MQLDGYLGKNEIVRFKDQYGNVLKGLDVGESFHYNYLL